MSNRDRYEIKKMLKEIAQMAVIVTFLVLMAALIGTPTGSAWMVGLGVLIGSLTAEALV